MSVDATFVCEAVIKTTCLTQLEGTLRLWRLKSETTCGWTGLLLPSLWRKDLSRSVPLACG
jgi:hypothetical protein